MIRGSAFAGCVAITTIVNLDAGTKDGRGALFDVPVAVTGGRGGGGVGGGDISALQWMPHSTNTTHGSKCGCRLWYIPLRSTQRTAQQSALDPDRHSH